MGKNLLLYLVSACVAVGLLITLTGCASMSEGQCHTANWYQVGFDDGYLAKGSRIDAHYDACSEYNITVNQAQYHQGYEQGLRNYCTSRNGWRRGTEGTPYSNFCQADLEGDFFNAYAAGADYFRLQLEMKTLVDKKNSLEKRAIAENSGLSQEDKMALIRQADIFKSEIDRLIYESTILLGKARENGWSY
ncbi:DUF2799 domain-containing protein [Aliikangiella sp. IMCC44653]